MNAAERPEVLNSFTLVVVRDVTDRTRLCFFDASKSIFESIVGTQPESALVLFLKECLSPRGVMALIVDASLHAGLASR